MKPETDNELSVPSKFWESLNRFNADWIESDGLENFKRTVNNNYFNWMVSLKTDYFFNAMKHLLGAIPNNPKLLWLLAVCNIKDDRAKTTIGQKHMSWFNRTLYCAYLVALNNFVIQQDEFSLFLSLSEPLAGNPIAINIGDRLVSQDLCNSYLEYCFIRRFLGGSAFGSVKSILEIGGGYGRLAYVFKQLHPEMKITLVDLPVALSVAAWYLPRVTPSGNDHQFLTPNQLELSDCRFDLAINISSFQEMTREQVNRYYDLIDRSSKFFYTKQWSFWTNPVDRQAMPAVIYPTRPHWELMGTRINPIHSKFFEALFKT